MTTALGTDDRLRSSVPFFCAHISRSGRRRVPSGEVRVESITITMTAVEFVELVEISEGSARSKPLGDYASYFASCPLGGYPWGISLPIPLGYKTVEVCRKP